MATFGRQLAGTSDALRGFDLVLLKIEDQTVVAISGKAHHTMARFTGRASDVVSGKVFAVTPDEIQNADKYEVAAVKRVAVVLQSGVRAWAYSRRSTRAFGLMIRRDERPILARPPDSRAKECSHCSLRSLTAYFGMPL